MLVVFDQIRSVDSHAMAAHAPDPFGSLLRRMLASDPDDRAITMREIADILLATAESPLTLTPIELSPTVV
jgi:hypothetical protein